MSLSKSPGQSIAWRCELITDWTTRWGSPRDRIIREFSDKACCGSVFSYGDLLWVCTKCPWLVYASRTKPLIYENGCNVYDATLPVSMSLWWASHYIEHRLENSVYSFVCFWISAHLRWQHFCKLASGTKNGFWRHCRYATYVSNQSTNRTIRNDYGHTLLYKRPAKYRSLSNTY